jgi:hypothetical protein
MTNDESGAGDSLRLAACPGCDFSLATLPPEGLCPECGRAYDQRFVILTGKGRGVFDYLPGGTWRGVVITFLSMLVIVWLATRRSSNLFMLIWPVLMGLTLVAHGYVRIFSSRSPGMQLWMSRDGFAQIASTPEARNAHLLARYVWIVAFPIYVIGNASYRGESILLITFATIVVSVIFTAVAILLLTRQTRRERAREDDAPTLCPWDRIINWRLDGSRLRLNAMIKWGDFKVRRRWLADIEVALTTTQLEQLRQQIIEWSGKQPSP